MKINFFNKSFEILSQKPYHNHNEGINEMLIDLNNRFVNEKLADKMQDLGFPQHSLYYHTHSKFGILNRMSIDFAGQPSSAFSLFELMQFIQEGSKLNECFNGRFSARGLHTLNANSLSDFLIQYYNSNPEYFDFS
jgi:hypothetical protein